MPFSRGFTCEVPPPPGQTLSLGPKIDSQMAEGWTLGRGARLG